MWSSTEPVCKCELVLLTFKLSYSQHFTLFTVTLLSVQAIFNTNNSAVPITLIGEGASALTCHTELTTCCREQDNPSGGTLGKWIGPDLKQIPESSSTSGFYVTRQQSSISLNYGGNSTVGGQYCCVMPQIGEDITFCIQIHGNYAVHSLIKANSESLCMYISLHSSGLEIMFLSEIKCLCIPQALK